MTKRQVIIYFYILVLLLNLLFFYVLPYKPRVYFYHCDLNVYTISVVLSHYTVGTWYLQNESMYHFLVEEPYISCFFVCSFLVLLTLLLLTIVTGFNFSLITRGVSLRVNNMNCFSVIKLIFFLYL